MINFRYGPDGSVFVIDWYDKNQCHSNNPDLHDKTLGRIFKISHERDKWITARSAEAAVRGVSSICNSTGTTGTSTTRGAFCRSAAPIRRCTPVEGILRATILT